MLKGGIYLVAIGMIAVSMGACMRSVAPEQDSWHLHNMVAPVQKSVVTVAVLDIADNVLRIGSGFFIDRDGTLVTNDHVLDGAYKAEIKTADGNVYPIDAVIARNPLVDLLKVRVQIPPERAVPAVLATEDPAIADRVVVIGSPMGLEQTISEGIVSAVRDHPPIGKVYQLTAPISPGSSGGPALNLKGQVIGVVSFQAARGQNLNFAVSVKTLQMLTRETRQLSIAEWTLEKAGRDPGTAIALCRQGARLSINGQYKEALAYYQKAAETNPDDPDTWRGLGSCYVGLDEPDHALEAFQQSIAAAPDNAAGHFMLAMYYKVLEQFPSEIPPLLQVIRLDPENIQARFELAEVYGRVGQTQAQIETYKAILEREPDHVPSLHGMGRIMGRLGRHDDALDLLRRASTLAPENAEIFFDMGVAYNAKNLPDEELRAYTKAISVNPKLAPAHYNMALIFLKQGNRKLALQQYAILKSLDTQVAEALFIKVYPQSIDKITSPEFSQ